MFGDMSLMVRTILHRLLIGLRKGKRWINWEGKYSSPEILMQRLRVDKLERLKKFDMFISHNSKNEEEVVDFYKILNNNSRC